jgi:hypothetical protein
MKKTVSPLKNIRRIALSAALTLSLGIGLLVAPALRHNAAPRLDLPAVNQQLLLADGQETHGQETHGGGTKGKG